MFFIVPQLPDSDKIIEYQNVISSDEYTTSIKTHSRRRKMSENLSKQQPSTHIQFVPDVRQEIAMFHIW